MTPQPASVRYNDWRQVDVPAPEAFTPTMPVSVVIPCWQTPVETLARTLAALEGQTYPRDLFEVVIIDDGSEPPVERPPSTPLDVKVVRQERRGFGLARARNTGARAASHDILLFLDDDVLVEAAWMAAHARWHHVVSDALTLGSRGYVAVDGIDAEMIRRRPGSLEELFWDRPVRSAQSSWVEAYLNRTNDLTSRADDAFNIIVGGNFGIGKAFFGSVGGNDESFTRWGVGLEDNELSYRAYTRGALLVPVRDAAAWHQGSWEEGRDTRRRIPSNPARGQAAHLIAHGSLRRSRPGRIFTVPQYVVTVDGGQHPADQIIQTVGTILADRVHDLVVRIDTQARDDDDERLAWLRDEFGSDPRRTRWPRRPRPLTNSPLLRSTSGFLLLVVFAKDLVHRLRVTLRDAVTAVSMLPDGSRVCQSPERGRSIGRGRAGGSPADFGEARKIRAKALKLRVAALRKACAPHCRQRRWRATPTRWEYLLARIRDIRSPGEAWLFLKWLSRYAWAAARRRSLG